jgi:MFS family permease
VCDAGWIPYFGQSAFSLGSTIGTLVLGLLADKIGRLPVLLISNAIAAAANVVTALSPTTFVSYAVVRLIAGTASDCNFNMMYLLGTFFTFPSPQLINKNTHCTWSNKCSDFTIA